MHNFTSVFLLVYAALFPIINPIGGAPIFLGLTSSRTESERNALARGVAINSVLLIAGSMFVGSHILVFFGITLPIVRIAGGLVVIAFAWKLLQTGVAAEAQGSTAVEQHHAPIDSFYPLTMPLTVGPGTISVAIALGSQRPGGAYDFASLTLLSGVIAGIIATALTIYVCYRFGERVIALLGKNGTNVVVRLSAFILLCIGLQILWTGYSSLTGVGTLAPPSG
ncbi:MAG TPA: NAAT family transporter [Ancylobacter sp.]